MSIFPAHAAINRLTPFAHVPDVDRAIAFYTLLGFTIRGDLRDHTGKAFWACVESGNAHLMLAQADGPVAPEDQAVLFYLYTHDVAAIRTHLLANGISDGGDYCGAPIPAEGCACVFKITKPMYMPEGEVRV